MRILLFSGKGGVGKTSLAVATGLRLAERGRRTLVMSVDPAHSVADACDLDATLFASRTSEPCSIAENLDIQEVNIQAELTRHWREISSYLASVLRTTGVADVEAEELAIFPGMEELSAMLYVNQFAREERYDVIVLDCAPTAESLRFVSMPSTLDWYIRHIFPVQRTVLKAVRPVANRVSPVELPPDRYFANVLDLARGLEGIDGLLSDPTVTSVRLVTNPETMVLRETQRAFVYFTLHGLTVDGILVNRVLPAAASGGFFEGWHRSQQRILEEVEQYFAPIEVHRIPLQASEVVGLESLRTLASALYREDDDPAVVRRLERPYSFDKLDGRYVVRLRLPFASKEEIGLFKKGDELVVRVGTLRRHIGLPTSMARLTPARASLDDRILTVELQ